MKRIFTAAAVCLTLLVMAVSCAKDAPNYSKELSRESFEAWVTKYAPDAQPYKDVYIQFIERGPEDAAKPVIGYSWIKIGYTGNILNGSVFTTRFEPISRLVGQFKYTTHYTDDFVEYSMINPKLCPGLRTALETMRAGDSVRIFIPGDRGYSSGMNMNAGYFGEAGVEYANGPIYFDMRLAASILSPGNAENDSVKNYAKQHWGTDYIMDTIGLYVHLDKRNPAGDTITQDSSVFVYYEQYFMDGFLCRTNVDSIAKKFDQYDSENVEKYDAIQILPLSEKNNTTQKVLFLTVPNMRKGETADVVTVSTWSFGNGGLSESDLPEILPFQPMLYRIHVAEKNPLEDDDVEGGDGAEK